jgi:hypothetical protein
MSEDTLRFLATDLYDQIVQNCEGEYYGYTDTGWCMSDIHGEKVETTKVEPYHYLCVSNHGGYIILWVNEDMTLTKCKRA